MRAINSVVGGLAAAVLVLSGAQAETASKTSLLSLFDRIGIERAGEYFPGIVHLSSAGNNCTVHIQSAGRRQIPHSLEEQVLVTLCTLAESMQEAAVSFDEVVEAQFTVRDEAIAELVLEHIANDELFAELDWSVEISDELPIDNDRVLVAMEIVALSPDSDDALVLRYGRRPLSDQIGS